MTAEPLRRLRPRAALALAAAMGAGAASAVAAPDPGTGGPCGVHAEIVARLGSDYGETRRALGLQGGATVMEVYASDATGSWTILLTSPDGVSCLVAAGGDWAAAPSAPAPGPAAEGGA